MAEILIASGTQGTAFTTSTGLYDFAAASVELLISDNDPGSPVFSPGEAVTLGGFVGSYVGLTTIGGVEYPVFINDNLGYTVVYGIAIPDDDTFPDVASLNISPEDFFSPCFAAGSRIATPVGEVAVEMLRIGDEILTATGEVCRVLWVGTRKVSTRFARGGPLQMVRVRAGALGDGLPVRDLVLTGDHALMIDGLLINACALVNGHGIDFVPLGELGDSYTVYHIETEDHAVILAEGVPAETYIDYVGRQAFDNYAEYVALYGGDRTIAENPAPRITSARHLPAALRARLRIVAAA